MFLNFSVNIFYLVQSQIIIVKLLTCFCFSDFYRVYSTSLAIFFCHKLACKAMTKTERPFLEIYLLDLSN